MPKSKVETDARGRAVNCWHDSPRETPKGMGLCKTCDEANDELDWEERERDMDKTDYFALADYWEGTIKGDA